MTLGLSPHSSMMRRTISSTCPTAPNTIPDLIASSVVLPITLGGESTALTAGLTWYANPNVKIYANYTMVDNDVNADAGGSLVGDDDYGVLQARVMAAF